MLVRYSLVNLLHFLAAYLKDIARYLLQRSMRMSTGFQDIFNHYVSCIPYHYYTLAHVIPIFHFNVSERTSSRKCYIQPSMGKTRSVKKYSNFIKGLTLTFVDCHGEGQAYRKLIHYQKVETTFLVSSGVVQVGNLTKFKHREDVGKCF